MTTVLEAFAGVGGQALGWHRAGAEHVAFIEREPFARRILARHWPDVPAFDDVTTFDASPFRGRVDVLTGGPPCQPVSTAGKRGGTDDDRWLWGDFVALAVALAAPVVVAENPPGLLSAQGGGAMYAVLSAFGDAGYSVEWDCLAAGTLGAPHRRERVFLVARLDGGMTWPAAGQPSLFRGRPGSWPWAGRWHRHTLTTRERQWPTPSPLPWEVAAEVEALPTPQAHDAQGEPGAGTVARGGRERDLPGAVRRALPTPPSADGERSSENGLRGEGNPTLLGEARRRALPTPTARDCNDSGDNIDWAALAGKSRLAEVSRGQDAPATGRLSPALPEWMMGLPDGWSLPDGPPLLDAPSRPYLPDLTAELALTTEREHRRPRLKGLGNACAVDVAEFIARTVLESIP